MLKRSLAAFGLAAMMVLAAAVPAFADPGGVPNPAGDCGLGTPLVAEGMALPGPGVSDVALISPLLVGCIGKP